MILSTMREGFFLLLNATDLYSQNTKEDADVECYTIENVPIPEGVFLEVGGMTMLPDHKLEVASRRGEIWFISNPDSRNNMSPHYTLFAQGLHEPLGLSFRDGYLFAAQRAEITRLADYNGDNVADEYKTVFSFNITGNYHEYAYGPKFDREGNMYVNLNLNWNGQKMISPVKWRGWMLRVDTLGNYEPIATGMRS